MRQHPSFHYIILYFSNRFIIHAKAWILSRLTFVTTLRNFETNIRNLQKKLKESNIEEHLFVIVDQLSWYYYGVFDAPTYKVAHRKDGSSFPLVSESFNRLFKELQDELYEEDKREREETFLLQLNSVFKSLNVIEAMCICL